MSNTTIQIKRSTITANPSNLQPGELAYTSNGEILFIGSAAGSNTANVVAIGGARTPGVLTANQALVANSSSWIDAVQTSKLIVGDTNETINITSIAVFSNATHLGTASNNELASSYAIKNYVDEKITASGAASQLNDLADVDVASPANNNLLIYDGDAGQWEAHTIDGTTNEVEVTFSGQDITIGLPDSVTLTTSLTVGNTFVNASLITATSLAGNGASITSVNAATLGGNTAADLNSYADSAASTAYSNAASYADTAAGTAYSNAVSYANTAAGTAYSNAVSYADTVANSAAGTAYSNAVSYADTAAGTAYSNAINFAANASNLTTGTLANGRLSSNVSITTLLSVGSNVNIDTSSITVGNSTVNTNITSTSIDTDGTFAAGNTVITGTLDANNTTITGTANVTDTLYINTDVYITANLISVGNSTVNTQISAGNVALNGSQLSLGNSTTNTIISSEFIDLVGYVAIGESLTIGNTTVNTFANATNLVVADIDVDTLTATGNVQVGNFTATGDVALGSNTSDTVSINGVVNTNIMPSANVTYDLGSQNSQWKEIHANNAHFNYLTVDHDVQIAGNLVVTGSLTTINVSTLEVSDPLVHFAANNTADTVDIGFVGHYSDDGGSTSRHTGLFRDASDGTYKLFTNLTQAGLDDGDTTIDTSNASYQIAQLQAYLESGALVSNSSAVTITANSTLSVDITANTLTLNTALGVPSGGTGRSSLSNNAVLVGNSAGVVTEVSSSTLGHVLQINSSGAPQFAMLDGGTF